MKTKLSIILLAACLTSTCSFANGSMDNSQQASKHSALAASHGTKASVQVASVASAVPLISVGSAGVVSVAAGASIIDAAVSKPQPLEVTEITITADRSPKAMLADCEE
ncbi:hypothetical protein HR060_02605 [Catenovulum sp. SM1970]|uniref:hypothetical protein n=1 Tax=Marinifaba aquimaris TaxID=2741323 RepID=UPI0015723ED9|nr:hypothetical protein [Marinifaba aquimaris]NTS75747.1 hypothetical protein [Marinifaba aquimaris]